MIQTHLIGINLSGRDQEPNVTYYIYDSSYVNSRTSKLIYDLKIGMGWLLDGESWLWKCIHGFWSNENIPSIIVGMGYKGTSICQK